MRGPVNLIDLEDTDGNYGNHFHGDATFSKDLKFAFELREGENPGIIFITLSPPEKNEWMSAFTMLLIRRYAVM